VLNFIHLCELNRHLTIQTGNT